MTVNRLLIEAPPGEVWGALCRDDDLIDLRLVRSAGVGRSGELHLGRVVRLLPELPAALVDIGEERPAFLGAAEAGPGGLAALQEGAAVIAQIKTEARDDKATGITLTPRLAGRFCALAPHRGGILPIAGADPAAVAAEGAVLQARWDAILTESRKARPPRRLAAAEPTAAMVIADFVDLPLDAIVIDDRAVLAEARAWLIWRRPTLVDRLAFHAGSTPLFDEAGIAADIETALASEVPLPGGGRLLIERCAAATMIDVDSGSSAAQASVNRAAARVIARQIRLRNLAGPMVVDFVGMRRSERQPLLDLFTRALTAEVPDVDVLGWTRLGHIELVRPRRRAPLADLLFEAVPGRALVKTAVTVALAALRAVAAEDRRAPVGAVALHVHPEVAAVLNDGEVAAARRLLETRLGRALPLVAEPGRSRESFEIARGDPI